MSGVEPLYIWMFGEFIVGFVERRMSVDGSRRESFDVMFHIAGISKFDCTRTIMN